MSIKIALLASGSGTNAARIISLAQAGRLDVEIGLVLSNRPEAEVLNRAKKLNVPYLAIDHRQFPDRESFDMEMLKKLRESDCQLVVLAGYMRLLSKSFLQAFPEKIINIHPALLPSFPGTHGAADAVSYGVKISGASVHFVEEEMDRGPLIIQGAVPVLSDDAPEDLQKRIHAVEYRIYPQAIQWIAQGRLRVTGRQVKLKEKAVSQIHQPGDCLIWPPLEEDF